MLGDVSGLEKIYIVCGYTDMRKSIDGLDRKSTRLNSSHASKSRMPSSA